MPFLFLILTCHEQARIICAETTLLSPSFRLTGPASAVKYVLGGHDLLTAYASSFRSHNCACCFRLLNILKYHSALYRMLGPNLLPPVLLTRVVTDTACGASFEADRRFCTCADVSL